MKKIAYKVLKITIVISLFLNLTSCFLFYNTPKEAVESGFDEIIDNSKYNLVDEEIDIITIDDCTIYIYTSQDTIQIAFLDKERSQYNLKSLKSYYSMSDIKKEVEGPMLVNDKNIYFNLCINEHINDKSFNHNNYTISAYGEEKTYYFSYKVVANSEKT